MWLLSHWSYGSSYHNLDNRNLFQLDETIPSFQLVHRPHTSLLRKNVVTSCEIFTCVPQYKVRDDTHLEFNSSNLLLFKYMINVSLYGTLRQATNKCCEWWFFWQSLLSSTTTMAVIMSSSSSTMTTIPVSTAAKRTKITANKNNQKLLGNTL